MKIIKQSPIHDGLRVLLCCDNLVWRTVIQIVKTGERFRVCELSNQVDAEEDYVKRCIRIAVYL